MADDSLEKQHQATSKRLDELKRKGQIMRSRDLTSGLVLVITVMTLIFLSNRIKTQFEGNFISSFYKIREVLTYEDVPFGFIKEIVWSNVTLLMPIFMIAVASAFLSPFLFGGWNFTFQPIQVKLEKLDPISNLKNIFSKRMFVNIIKSFLKVSIIIGVLVMFVLHNEMKIANLTNLSIHNALYGSYSIINQFVIVMCASLIFIVLSDVFFTYLEFQKKTKMSSQELKDEVKDTEGSIEAKRKIRAAQFSMLKQRLSVTVPKATVVITNPTHYAIAIRYDPNKDKAPKVLAKGKDYVAHQIRRISISNAIPIYEAPLLARAIYNTSKIGAEIKPELYMAVALVLSYVHQLKNYQQGVGQEPIMISDLEIPNEFIFHE